MSLELVAMAIWLVSVQLEGKDDLRAYALHFDVKCYVTTVVVQQKLLPSLPASVPQSVSRA